MTDKVCVVAGVGPGTGAAIARSFAARGYQVAMLARDAERLVSLEAEIPGTRGYTVDVTDAAQITEVFARIRSDLGPVDVLVHNAVMGSFGAFLDATVEQFELAFRTNTLSLLLLGQAVVPDMQARGSGAIIVTGNTSATRGKANFAAFAPSKAAQRVLAQSMARSLRPLGIHVAYIVIDAVIKVPWTSAMFADRPDEFFAQPGDIAESVYHLATQARSAWTFEMDLRPFGEQW